MTKKHTPGPWRMTANRKLVKVLAAGMPVASVTSERAEEDARLIALAPELLAFAERVAADGCVSRGVPSCQCTGCAARSLLARVRGEIGGAK